VLQSDDAWIIIIISPKWPGHWPGAAPGSGQQKWCDHTVLWLHGVGCVVVEVRAVVWVEVSWLHIWWEGFTTRSGCRVAWVRWGGVQAPSWGLTALQAATNMRHGGAMVESSGYHIIQFCHWLWSSTASKALELVSLEHGSSGPDRWWASLPWV